jgi:hypothetical protein
MLTGGADPLYRRALATPRRPYTRIAVFDGNGNPLTNLAYGQRTNYDTATQSLLFYSASVSATLGSRVSRTMQFTVHESLYPILVTAMLAPYGNIVRAYSGIEFVDGDRRYSWQVFGGRIQDVVWDSASATVQVTCADFAADVVDNGFLRPENSNVGQLCTEQIKSLIVDGVPSATFGTSDTFSNVMPQLTWESDRGAALDEIGQSLGAFWYPLANEQFVIRRIPWTVAGAPVVTLTDGQGGVITRFRVGRSRSEVYNAIAVTGERADGTTPVYAQALDSDPASPTYVLGPFGRRTRQVHLQSTITQGQAQSVANDLLQSSKALTESWDVSIFPDASLELGDVVEIDAGGRSGVIQVISGFQLPLDRSSDMVLQLRSQVPGLLEGIDA